MQESKGEGAGKPRSIDLPQLAVRVHRVRGDCLAFANRYRHREADRQRRRLTAAHARIDQLLDKDLDGVFPAIPGDGSSVERYVEMGGIEPPSSKDRATESTGVDRFYILNRRWKADQTRRFQSQ